MKYPLIIFLLGLGLWTNACDCDSIKGLNEADIVFTGRVIKIKKVESPYVRYEITFQVYGWQKVAKKSYQVTIDIPCLLDACCGVQFEMGHTYQVFAYVEKNRFKTNRYWANSKIR